MSTQNAVQCIHLRKVLSISKKKGQCAPADAFNVRPMNHNKVALRVYMQTEEKDNLRMQVSLGGRQEKLTNDFEELSVTYLLKLGVCFDKGLYIGGNEIEFNLV